MAFTIQYFASRDRLIYAESIDGRDLVEALDRARAVLKDFQHDRVKLEYDPDLAGYVILNPHGRLVARGYIRSNSTK
jgi:hypothetical protein